jgi:site-specific recombinase XerD
MAGQIIRKGDRKWPVRVVIGRDGAGKRRYVSKLVHGGKKDAEKELTRLQSQRHRGALVLKPKETLDDFLDAWLETTAKPSVRARTLEDYTATLKRYVRPYLGSVRYADVTPTDIRAMLVKLTDRGLSPRTVRKALEVLRNALEQAVSDRMIPDNPARARLVKKALPQKEQKEPETIATDRVPAFLAAAEGTRLHALWLLQLFSGLRPSEALALRWRT